MGLYSIFGHVKGGVIVCLQGLAPRKLNQQRQLGVVSVGENGHSNNNYDAVDVGVISRIQRGKKQIALDEERCSFLGWLI